MDRSDDDKAGVEAAEWVARLNARAVTTEDLDAFYEWRRQPPNEQAYARAEAMWRQARTLAQDPDVDMAVRDALSRPRREIPGHFTRRALIAGAVALPVAVGAAWWLSAGKRYQTERGQQLLVALEDGSQVRLNTDTSLWLHASEGSRRVTLERGQAFFDMRPHPGRFEIRAGELVARAAQARIDVRRWSDRAQVVLASGEAGVESRDGTQQLALNRAGDCAAIGAGRKLARSRVDAEAAFGWTSGRLIFRGTPLGDAIVEANRYATSQIELRDEDLRALPVDGTFETGDLPAFVAAMSALFGLKATTDANRIVLSRA